MKQGLGARTLSKLGGQNKCQGFGAGRNVKVWGLEQMSRFGGWNHFEILLLEPFLDFEARIIGCESMFHWTHRGSSATKATGET